MKKILLFLFFSIFTSNPCFAQDRKAVILNFETEPGVEPQLAKMAEHVFSGLARNENWNLVPASESAPGFLACRGENESECISRLAESQQLDVIIGGRIARDGEQLKFHIFFFNDKMYASIQVAVSQSKTEEIPGLLIDAWNRWARTDRKETGEPSSGKNGGGPGNEPGKGMAQSAPDGGPQKEPASADMLPPLKKSASTNSGRAGSMKEKKEDGMFRFGFFGAWTQDYGFTANDDLGFWGFRGENVEKQYFGGYMFGIVLGLRLSNAMETYIDAGNAYSSLLMGKKGYSLHGMSIWDADPNHESSTSPVLDRDVYYVSKVTFMRVGTKIILSIDEFMETYLGLGVGLAAYEIGFGNRDGSRAYSEIVYDTAPTFAITFGYDYNIFIENQRICSIGFFFEIAGTPKEESTTMRNWLWEGWTYHFHSPVFPAFRLGLRLSN